MKSLEITQLIKTAEIQIPVSLTPRLLLVNLLTGPHTLHMRNKEVFGLFAKPPPPQIPRHNKRTKKESTIELEGKKECFNGPSGRTLRDRKQIGSHRLKKPHPKAHTEGSIQSRSGTNTPQTLHSPIQEVGRTLCMSSRLSVWRTKFA